MSEQKSDNPGTIEIRNSAVVFVHAGHSGKPSAQWLEHLLALGMPVFSHAEYAGCIKTSHNFEQTGELLCELAKAAPQCPVLILSSDIEIEAETLSDISSSVSDENKIVACTVFSNLHPGTNPFAGLIGNQETARQNLAGLFSLLGPGLEHQCLQWPKHFIALSSPAVSALKNSGINPGNALMHLHEAGGKLKLSDRHFAFAPSKSLFNSNQLEAHENARPPAWGELSSRLQDWLDAGCPNIGNTLLQDRPLTLHITHSWGGGIALWTETFIRFDQASNHLQLRSVAAQSGQGPGQQLCLYAANQLDFPIASWWIQPPIQSVDEQNDHYRQVLDEICQRFGVGRIIISSLVGHSLDALRTRIPTVQVLHDHFPVWPLLSANPNDYVNKKGKIDLKTAMADRKLAREFKDRSTASWQSVRNRYLADIKEYKIKISAPGQSVIDLQEALDSGWPDIDIALIPHGFPPFKDHVSVVPKPRQDGRLRLVILGRIQTGKGQKLLLQAVSRLQEFAQVYLVGTGKSGEAFFGLTGVNVIMDYQREGLPSLLKKIGPDAAALLSLVPETFSYTLSELQHFAIPTIATRVGSFPGRIENGKTGWLIEASSKALTDLVSYLHENRDELNSVRKNLEQQHDNDPGEMVAAYQTLCTPEIAQKKPAARQHSVDTIQASALAYQSSVLKQAAKTLEEEVQVQKKWALESQRDLKEEQGRRKHWVGLLEKEAEHLKGVIGSQKRQMGKEADHYKGVIGSQKRQMEQQDTELVDSRHALEKTRHALEKTIGEYQQVLASSSWRITRPFRVLRRTAQNFMLSRAWNPLRWPLLISGLIRNLATVGLRGTLMRLQFGGFEEVPKPMPVDAIESIGDPDPPASVPASDRPVVSIVIPAYNNWLYTAACLRSISEASSTQNIEIILVDDESSDETEHNASRIAGLRYFRNSKNMGFIDSCNLGAEKAKGKYLVFLNNDTQVMDGWLDTLLDVFRQDPDAGLVGSRLIYPNGTLQECGGIIFNDGSGWNYGRNDNPDRPEYMHVRQVDYCSGACLMIESGVFQELGKFSEDYKPAYYEDTDLAFRVRASGRKVLVQPASTVIHHEGVTSGTDTNSGIKKYQVINQEKFVRNWSAELAAYPDRIEDPTNPAFVRAARDHRHKGRVLIIDATTPEPDQDSGSLRLTHIMRCFRDLGFGVTFFADNHMHSGRYTRQLQQWEIEVQYEPWLQSNQDFLRRRGAEFDFVMVSRHYVATNYPAMVRKFCPNAKFIFDTVDLHYLREQRLAELENSAALRQVANQTRRSELAVIEQSDAVLVVSETEVEVLANDAPDALVHVLSNIHEVPGRQLEFKDRKDIIFVGGYQHPPNIDAAIWFVNNIWPLIHEVLPDVRFHLIGSKAPKNVSSLTGDGVIFHGFVEDLEHYLDHCRLAVAPLRYGAGVKGKVNMSMSHGQPIVATPVAIEGLHAEHGREVLVAESEQDFANEVIRLYRDEKLWNKISDAAIQNVESHFSVSAARKSVESLIRKLQNPNSDHAL